MQLRASQSCVATINVSKFENKTLAWHLSLEVMMSRAESNKRQEQLKPKYDTRNRKARVFFLVIVFQAMAAFSALHSPISLLEARLFA